MTTEKILAWISLYSILWFIVCPILGWRFNNKKSGYVANQVTGALVFAAITILWVLTVGVLSFGYWIFSTIVSN